MTARQAEELAEKIWGNGQTRFGKARRRRTSPRFAVGYADIESGRAVTQGVSDVDWESAFAVATGAMR